MSAPTRHGLTVPVYRDASGSDCTLGGISATHARLTVVGVLRYPHGAHLDPVVEELCDLARRFAPTDDAPAVWLVIDRARPGDVFVLPARDDTEPEPPGRYMFGGNLAHCHDGRLLRLVGNHYGVRIHDRREGPPS